MKPDWSSPDLNFLRSKLERGEVTFFAGAGFSFDARNRLGQSPPLGANLAALLAKEAGFTLANEPLPLVYEAAIRTIGSNKIWELLKTRYSITEFDEWYKIFSSIVWRRIFTLNIDTLIQQIYGKKSEQNLDTIVCPSPPLERDAHFRDLQCVHLHGHVAYPNAGLTFSQADFARHTAQPDPWYQTLVDDLYQYPVLFVGSLLDEPQLHHYLEVRSLLTTSIQEFRPKSFLVSPDISEIRAITLRERNIIPLSMTGGDFFRSLSQAIKLEDLALAKVRRRVYPHVEFNDHQPWRGQFNKDFELILPGIQSPQPKKLGSFFLGDEPTWDDIREGLDGAREVNERLLKLLLDPSERSQTVVLHGPAGGGKSTTLMRVAFLLAQSGKAVYFANARHRLDFRSIGLIARGLEVGQRLYVFADNLATHLDSIVDSLNELKNSTNLTCVFADRSNNYYSRMPALRELQPHELRMPDLVRSDVNSILDRLEKFKFLGVLKNMPRPRQVKEFLDRASKQLLVAMREATSGKGFERILRDEFDGHPPEAQLAYAICSLAVHAGARGVHTRHLTGCLGNSILAQHAIQNQLFWY